MDSRTFILGVAALIVSASIGMVIGNHLTAEAGPEKYSESVNYTLNSENDTRTVEFDNRTIDLSLEDRGEAELYIDKDLDGSFDIRARDLNHDGRQHTATQFVTFNRTSYRLYFRYSDNQSVSDDAYFTVYQIQQI